MNERFRIFFDEYALGYTTFENGARTADIAKRLNPYHEGVDPNEDARYLSWNRGWNEAKMEHEGDKI